MISEESRLLKTEAKKIARVFQLERFTIDI